MAAALLSLSPCAFADDRGAQLALVIDDLGYSLAHGRRALELPVPATVAILPFAPNAQLLANAAERAGKEVIVHLPMESLYGRSEDDTLTVAMTQQTFRAVVARALQTLPQSVGVNNHTGSLLTQHAQRMGWLMDSIRTTGKYFLDSRTTPHTVAFDTAVSYAVPVLQRDVFLDHDPRPGALAREFERARRLAHERGHAVLIAHPHPTTLGFLERMLPTLTDIELVPASHLLPTKDRPATLALH